MKIAITADVHLREEYPERLAALRNILEQVKERGIQQLFIAGDLFDKDGDDSCQSIFARVCGDFPEVQIHVIPGNHDLSLSAKDFDVDNLTIYTQPQFIDLGQRELFLMVPYSNNVGMGEVLSSTVMKAGERDWVLVGHGDYLTVNREPNPRERRIYMPLRRGDVQQFKPKHVVLGHIHKPTPLKARMDGKVIYVGSPQGLDITETGKRRFLIYDDEAKDSFEEQEIATDIIYFNESFFVVPSDDEVANLKMEIGDRINWGLEYEERQKVRMRAVIRGCTQAGKPDIKKAVEDALKENGIELHKEKAHKTNPDTESLIVSSADPQRMELALKTLALIEELVSPEISDGEGEGKSAWDFGGKEPDLDAVKQEALLAIYKSS